MSFIYADACILIYLIEGDYSQKRQIKKTFSPLNTAPNKIGFSDLSRLECLVYPIRHNNNLLRFAYESFFKGKYSRYIQITPEVFENATQLRARYTIKTPDALHLTAAKLGGCDIFLTNDNRLEGIDAGVKIKILD